MKIGIIYKLTILAKYKFYGQRPFYVGQHWGMEDFNSYFGGGTIWNDFLNVVKKDYPLHWKKFVRREILYQGACDQRALDFLEQYYIKREMAHYTEEKGGCNVLRGTANAFGAGSPMKDENCKRKQAESLKKYYAEHASSFLGKHHTEATRLKISEANKGKKLPPFSAETKLKMSQSAKKAWAIRKQQNNYNASFELSCNGH